MLLTSLQGALPSTFFMASAMMSLTCWSDISGFFPAAALSPPFLIALDAVVLASPPPPPPPLLQEVFRPVAELLVCFRAACLPVEALLSDKLLPLLLRDSCLVVCCARCFDESRSLALFDASPAELLALALQRLLLKLCDGVAFFDWIANCDTQTVYLSAAGESKGAGFFRANHTEIDMPSRYIFDEFGSRNIDYK